MKILNLAKKDIRDVVLEFNSDIEKGLDSSIAEKRLSVNGGNILPDRDLKWWKIFLKQFRSPFIYLLLVASFLSFVFRQEVEGAMIFLFIIINTVLGFFQEYRSENTVKLLKKFIKIKTKVIRDGIEQEVDSENLVLGDIVVLETGDKISADLRILEASDLNIDESILTGESILVSKQAEIVRKEDIDCFSASNLCFSGTVVFSGRARAIVIAVGKDTFLGTVTKLTSQVKRVSDFEKGIGKFSSFILKLVLITLIFVFVFNAVFKDGLDFLQLTIFSIALAISVIPEALPLVMTFSFSKGAMNLAKKNVVVKRLSSVEDLGNIDILCSDKTGTLTENKLTILDFYESLFPAKDILLYANLAVARLSEKREPFDIALFDKLDQSDKNNLTKFEFIVDTPFDPRRQRNNVLLRGERSLEFVVRGAPEVLFDLCSNLKIKDLEDIRKWILDQGLLGRRVLAVAKKEIKEMALDDLKNNLIGLENGLEFLGLISFADPVKESVNQAVLSARDLNVGIKIITGDSPEVAGSVASQIGLISSSDKVFLGKDFINLSKEEKKKVLNEYHVFARVLPEQKFDIIKSLQENFNVGYLGDGINDAPALKIAGVSLVVQNASDIARETADIVLLEGDLNVIIEGIKEGRRIFANSSKYIKATLASNFGNFYAVAVASLLVNFLPMLPLQILLLNLLSDFPMIAIATDNVDKEELLSPKKYKVNDIIIIAIILGIVSSVFDFVYFAMFYKISPAVLQTNWFIGSIITELAFLFSIRTKKSIFKGYRPSFLVTTLSLFAVIITVVIPFTAWGQNLFKFIAPSGKHLLMIFGVAIIYLICSEIVKLMYYKNKDNKLVITR
ncbi:MAG: HAD-IC family P-type ATPase [Patescibacteria group bacterium]|nr:HAD-IC family P-type ATPase [Patescibacteria group bacterium]